MRIPKRLADKEHPIVRATAYRLIQGLEAPRDQLRALFYHVRDDILFGFVKDADIMKASETIRLYPNWQYARSHQKTIATIKNHIG